MTRGRTGPGDAPAPRAAPSAARRDEFMRVAADVFAERGFRGAGMREIAERCGVKPAALYYYFPSKAAMLEAICNYGVTQFVERLAAIQSAEMPIEEKIRRAVHAHLEPLLERRFYVHAFLFQRRELPPEVRRPLDVQARNYEELWHALLVEGQTLGAIARTIDRKVTVLAILGMCNAVARWSDAAVDRGLDAVSAAFSRLIISGLLAPRTAAARPSLTLIANNRRRKGARTGGDTP
ncbi:MAG: TetR family transcriptional regulator [Burkholderiales bacterium]|nr:TetR family transcriptional regulator [Burkholderiales bacterium]